MTTVLDARWSCSVALADSDALRGATVVIVGLFAGEIGVGARLLSDQLGLDPEDIAKLGDGMGEPSATYSGVLGAGAAGRRIVAVGLGARETLDLSRLRAAAASAARRLRASAESAVSLLGLELDATEAAAAVVEGHLLGAWRYNRVPSTSAADCQLTVVVGGEEARGDPSFSRAMIVAGVTNWVRQLVETPPNLLGPERFADEVVALADELAPGLVTAQRVEKEALRERGFGGILGVGAGSARPPLVLELTTGTGTPVGLAGKGITFDSGGINLKRDASELAWMKSDMAAAAAVAAAVIAAAALGSTRAMHAVLPIAENMPGSSAQRPGDVVTHPGGRTTEITDTDSEGRLVLADAIAWLASQSPVAIIDVGTLTDSGAVGIEYWGCWTTDPQLAAAVVAAGERAGDPGWLLPLHDSYADLIPSRVADSSNSPLEVPDTGQLAATYLRPFASDIPWLHIDNGSGAWLERDSRSWAAGPTGTPVRALIEYLAPSGAGRPR